MLQQKAKKSKNKILPFFNIILPIIFRITNINRNRFLTIIHIITQSACLPWNINTTDRTFAKTTMNSETVSLKRASKIIEKNWNYKKYPNKKEINITENTVAILALCFQVCFLLHRAATTHPTRSKTNS